MSAVLEGLKALGAARLVAMAAVGIGMIGLFAVLAMRGGNDRLALLYSDLDPREAGQIIESLERQHVAAQLAAGGTSILVPADQVTRMRVTLAKEGLPSGGSIGYEIFDKGDGLTTSQFQQKIAESRALEGELSRTIRAISGVRAARVHLVLPRREPFARERLEAQASVLVTPVGAGRLDREAVQAIVNLVAGAVPGLRAKAISVIDSKGNVLARAGEATGPTEAAQGAAEIKRGLEVRLARAVEEMLERSLGPGKVRAEANVEMDYDRIQETQEKFDPEGQVARSTQSVTDNTKSTEANASVSVQNNLPNADNGKEGAGSQEQRQEETTNYEIGRTVRTLVREQPQVRRLSVAVLVDGAEAKDGSGAMKWRARTPEELAQIARVVRSAVGYDEKRGDTVEVVNMPFAADADAGTAEKPGLLGIQLEKADLMRLGQNVLFAGVALLALLVFVRPMVNRLVAITPTGAGAMALAGEGSAGARALLGGSTQGAAISIDGNGVPRLAGPASEGGEEAAMVDVNNVEGQMRASSIRRLTSLVEAHPEESLTIMRAWMNDGSGA
jgi:flagellar M-ring protein FliF